ncbi:MAG: hypothetical protein FWC62_03500 [Firmicutes bacterium]|nr:hypothetical protein [Bacillota bacterium]
MKQKAGAAAMMLIIIVLTLITIFSIINVLDLGAWGRVIVAAVGALIMIVGAFVIRAKSQNKK